MSGMTETDSSLKCLRFLRPRLTMSTQEELVSPEVGKTEKVHGPPPKVGPVYGDLPCGTSGLGNTLATDDLPYSDIDSPHWRAYSKVPLRREPPGALKEMITLKKESSRPLQHAAL